MHVLVTLGEDALLEPSIEEQSLLFGRRLGGANINVGAFLPSIVCIHGRNSDVLDNICFVQCLSLCLHVT